MPPAVAGIAGGLVAIGFSAATATFLATAFIYAGANYLLNKAISGLTKRPRTNQGQGLEVNFAGTIEPRRLIGGTVKVGGMHNIPPISTGDNGEMGHAQIIHAGHEVFGITDVYLDQDLVADADIGAVTGTDNDGAVVAGKYANKVWIRRRLGTVAQTVDYILSQAYPLLFTADFRLRGWAHTTLRCKFDQKVFSGWPNLSVIGLGQKLYDPRLDSTKAGGAGSHREADPATWGFAGGIGANPALWFRHFLTNEVGFSHAEMIDSEVMAAANTCDASVNIPGAATQRRWTFNHLMIVTDEWEVTLRQIIDAMEGNCCYADGKWHVNAGEWMTPDVTIGMGDWVAPMIVQASANRDERWNFVRGWYVDPNRNWQRSECYPRRNAQYEVDDGNERIPLEYEIPFCASSAGTKHAEYEAQRHCEIQLRKSRNQIKCSGRLRPEFAKLIPGQTVYVNDSAYGFVLKSFRIVAVESGLGEEDGGADVALLEEGSGTWTDLAAGDYNTESVTDPLTPGATLPSLTADPVVIIGPNTISLNVSAGVPDTQPPGTEYAVIENQTSNYPPTSGFGAEVWRGMSPTAVLVRASTNTMHYWMIANVGTYKSGYRPTSAGIAVAPMSYGPAGLTISLQPSNQTKSGLASTNATTSMLQPNTNLVPNSPFLQYVGNNGAVTFSYQVLTYWYDAGGDASPSTPSPLIPATVTNNGSQHPSFRMVSSIMGWEESVNTRFKCTLRDTSTTLDSGQFHATFKSGVNLN